MSIRIQALARNGKREAELYLYGDVMQWGDDCISAKSVREALNEAGAVDSVTAYIQSPGGDMFEGVAIFNILSDLKVPVTTIVEGMCASAATLIAMSGSTRLIYDNARYMIHDPMKFTMGNQDAHLAGAALLGDFRTIALDAYEKGCAGKSSRKQLDDWMRAETWMNGQVSVDRGFSTGIAKREGVKSVAGMSAVGMQILAHYRNLPPDLAAAAKRVDWRLAHMATVSQSIDLSRQKDGPARKPAQ